MQKVIRVTDSLSLQQLNMLLDEGWKIVDRISTPFTAVTGSVGKNMAIKVYGGWVDYVVEEHD